MTTNMTSKKRNKIKIFNKGLGHFNLLVQLSFSSLNGYKKTVIIIKSQIVLIQYCASLYCTQRVCTSRGEMGGGDSSSMSN